VISFFYFGALYSSASFPAQTESHHSRRE